MHGCLGGGRRGGTAAAQRGSDGVLAGLSAAFTPNFKPQSGLPAVVSPSGGQRMLKPKHINAPSSSQGPACPAVTPSPPAAPTCARTTQLSKCWIAGVHAAPQRGVGVGAERLRGTGAVTARGAAARCRALRGVSAAPARRAAACRPGSAPSARAHACMRSHCWRRPRAPVLTASSRSVSRTRSSSVSLDTRSAVGAAAEVEGSAAHATRARRGAPGARTTSGGVGRATWICLRDAAIALRLLEAWPRPAAEIVVVSVEHIISDIHD